MMKDGKDAVAEMARALFDPLPSIFDRFPDIPQPGGVIMMNKIKHCYGVPGRIMFSVPWYDSDDRDCFICHPDNVRHHNSVIDEYEETVASMGVVQEGRGSPFAILSNTPTGLPYQLITFGSVSRAFYKADKNPLHKDKPAVIATRELGLQSVTVLVAKTPADVYSWVRDFHNSIVFQSGATTSFSQMLTELPQQVANWEAMCTLQGWQKGNLQERWTWLSTKSDKWSSQNLFDNSVALTNRMMDPARLNVMGQFSHGW